VAAWAPPLASLGLAALLASLVCPAAGSLMRWNESFTTLWKDCRNPGYTKSMVVHYKLKMIWCPNAKVGTTSMYDLFRQVLGTGEHVRCIKEVQGSQTTKERREGPCCGFPHVAR
jgi:hypothetical protein